MKIEFELSFKNIWRYLRIPLFWVWFIFLGCSILPLIILMSLGVLFWPLLIPLLTAIVALYIEYKERSLGWVDEY